ncbi:MAG: hypothetical protein CR982_01805 [Candidatus Cloacimonadota bacterium]|nr:MAG: hypothetical protein CR982_01805 [Candidatus Cloacimonadota bacterium]PIE80309.1 MAG: hypothetical protein CSA15_01995 [Candidatus Delongbacteria bacterium]
MKGIVLFMFALILGLSSLSAELINANPDPNGDPWWAGGLPEITPEIQAELDAIPEIVLSEESITKSLPEAVDNTNQIYFRSIFNQEEGCCGQASGVGYTFTYEINRLRGIASDNDYTQYPTHYTWNYLNKGTGYGSWYHHGWEIIKDSGCPNKAVWGGMAGNSKRWMSGYDKYYSAMSNTTLDYWSIFVGTPEGLETFKHWLNDHNEGSNVGGLGCFAAYIFGANYEYLPPESSESGKMILTEWGNTGYHAMTFVGYDDNVKYDFNGDGQFTNDIDINNDGVIDIRDWEIGALKIANSWGEDYPNDDSGGTVYMPYKLLGETSIYSGITGQKVYVLTAKETHEPKMTLRIKMSHPSRKDIVISTGVSERTTSTNPQAIKNYTAYTKRRGGSLPMQGINEEPIEIELDITSLIEEYPDSKKFFLRVKEYDENNEFSGTIYSYSLVDYRDGESFVLNGLESEVPIINDEITQLSIDYDVLPKAINHDMIIDHDMVVRGNTYIAPNNTVTIIDDCKLIMEENASFTVSNYSHLNVNSESFSTTGLLVVEGEGNMHIASNSTFSIKSSGVLKLMAGAEIKLNKNSEIIVENEASCISLGTPTNNVVISNSNSNKWSGIIANPGSNIKLNYTVIEGAKQAISGTPETFNIKNSTITGCNNGIFLADTDGYNICGNIIKVENEVEADNGIVVVESNGNIRENVITKFNTGVKIVLCSPLLLNNTIAENKSYGISVVGQVALPQLVYPNNMIIAYPPSNNTIKNNGIAQIYLSKQGNIYLSGGYNNVYSEPVNQVPNAHCIRAESVIDSSSVREILISARQTYWGDPEPIQDYFNITGNYILDFDFPASSEYPHSIIDKGERTKLLEDAISKENEDKYSEARLDYETLVEQYPDSKESYIALARLINNYKKENLDLSILSNKYMEILDNVVWKNKKFLEELLVRTEMVKDNYSQALTLANEMRSNAVNNDQLLCADINIAIAEAGIQGKGSQGNQKHVAMMNKLKKYLNYGEVFPTNESESGLVPSKFVLQQNYPNPFNPTTTISFNLPMESDVKLEIYNTNGKMVKSLLNNNMKSGIHSIQFDGSNLSSGVYYYKLTAGKENHVKKMMLIK